MRNFYGVLASCLILPLVAYLTIDRPAEAFSVRWALFILLVGSGVIVAAGWFRREQSDDQRSLVMIGALNVLGLIIAYVAGNWWMAAMASFTALISLVFAYSAAGPGASPPVGVQSADS